MGMGDIFAIRTMGYLLLMMASIKVRDFLRPSRANFRLRLELPDEIFRRS